MIDYCGQICYPSIFFLMMFWNGVFELWIKDIYLLVKIVDNLMFCFENFGFEYVLAIMIWCLVFTLGALYFYIFVD